MGIIHVSVHLLIMKRVSQTDCWSWWRFTASAWHIRELVPEHSDAFHLQVFVSERGRLMHVNIWTLLVSLITVNNPGNKTDPLELKTLLITTRMNPRYFPAHAFLIEMSACDDEYTLFKRIISKKIYVLSQFWYTKQFLGKYQFPQWRCRLTY